MRKIPLGEIFDIENGNGLALNNSAVISRDIRNISFVSRTSANNGISDMIDEINTIKPFKSGLITVSLGGSVLETFVQPNNFYTGFHVAILNPKVDMSTKVKQYYAISIRKNKYKYSYGRQANKSLHSIMLPHYEDLPSWVYEDNDKDYDKCTEALVEDHDIGLNDRDWAYFTYSDIFDIKRGSENKKIREIGHIPFISATEKNNGILNFVSSDKIEEPAITVASVGSVAETHWQDIEFIASSNVLILMNSQINKYSAMFLNMLIKKEKYRFSYGRVWSMEKMKKSKIKLPVDHNGQPDWQFMEDYIKTLPFSSAI